jgi:hypothetical protein
MLKRTPPEARSARSAQEAEGYSDGLNLFSQCDPSSGVIHQPRSGRAFSVASARCNRQPLRLVRGLAGHLAGNRAHNGSPPSDQVNSTR